MRVWTPFLKRVVRRPAAVSHSQALMPLQAEELFLFEHEFVGGRSELVALNDSLCPEALSHGFSPFVSLALRAGCAACASSRVLLLLLIWSLRIDCAFLRQHEAQLFGGTSVSAHDYAKFAWETFGADGTGMRSTADAHYVRLVITLLSAIRATGTSNEGSELTKVVSAFKGIESPLPFHILQLLLSVPVAPSVLACIVRCELEKCNADVGMGPGLLHACVEGLLANDHYFSPHHFTEMDSILRGVFSRIQPSFDYLSVRWTPMLNKLSRIYARQYQGEALESLHCVLLERLPALETKIPLPYLLRCIGSLVDAGMSGERTVECDGAIWRKIVAVASLAVRLFGSSRTSLQSIWTIFLKGAITLPPQSMKYVRTMEAYHLCASLGYPVAVDKAAFSQVVRFLVTVIEGLSIDDTALAANSFYRFIREHSSVNFLWAIDSLIPIMSEIWKVHGKSACMIVQSIVNGFKDDFFPSRGLSGIQIDNNPKIRRLLENFEVAGSSEFWWDCGCGAQLPSSAHRCLACLRCRNASWTCSLCGASHDDCAVGMVCKCGAAHPRTRQADASGFRLCKECGEVLSHCGGCNRCRKIMKEKEMVGECPSCGHLCSKHAVCCPACYSPNQSKNPLLWRCDGCAEFNHWTWSKCQHCPGKRRVGCIVTPLQPWVCGCGKQNHPCRTACERCSLSHPGTYTCGRCGVLSRRKEYVKVQLRSTELRLIVCEGCANVHPRDHNVLCSPFIPRHCHRCGVEYTRTSISCENCCKVCQSRLSYNELNPFFCGNCEHKSAQVGFYCTSCHALRGDVMANDVFVWRCLREKTVGESALHVSVCGGWNYSWCDSCHFCGEARAHSQYECRARFLPWTCISCESSNGPTDVLLCPNCDKGLQLAPCCPVCGLPHLTLECAVERVD